MTRAREWSLFGNRGQGGGEMDGRVWVEVRRKGRWKRDVPGPVL